MSLHIEAKKGDIAETVLLPGDPLRAKYIADTFLTDVKRYNTIRNMFGFTGVTEEGKKVSVQGSGMGMPSLAIYVNELIDSYDVKKIIRVGSAGSLQKDVKLKDIVLVQGSCSDSGLSKRRFDGMSFAPLASWELLLKAYEVAKELSIPVHVGNNFSTDKFYDDAEIKAWAIFSTFGVKTIEMESAELYTLAAFKKIQALSILTISDTLVVKGDIGAKDREQGFSDMMKIALKI